VVLPGLDAALPPAVWARLAGGEPGAADHPQHGFSRLAAALEFDPGGVPAWQPTTPPAPARNALVALALRPAPVTDQWRAEGAALVPGLAAATEGLAWVEAPDVQAEARAVALALRARAEAGGRGALVTPDRALARRVAGELDRWGLTPDDSAGRPLMLTPPGVLLRALAAARGRPMAPEARLAIRKHPLVASARGARRRHLELTGWLTTLNCLKLQRLLAVQLRELARLRSRRLQVRLLSGILIKFLAEEWILDQLVTSLAVAVGAIVVAGL
jgi:inactivated superfamily I helicase